MLDAAIRPYITPSLDKIAERIEAYAIPAGVVTLAGLGVGLIGCFFVAIQSYLFGLIILLASRVLSGLAGTIARRGGASDFDAYLHIVCTHVFYAAFVFFFVMALPNYYFIGLFLLFSLVGPMVSALADQTRTNKPAARMGTLANLIETSEMVILIILACLFPSYFFIVAFFFALLCWIMTFARTMQAWRASSVMERNYDEAESIH